MVKLKRENIILRSWKESDAKELSKIGSNKKIAKNMTASFPYPYTLKEAKKWIKIANEPKKKKTTFAIEFEGKLAGGAGFSLKEGHTKGVASGGYWLGKDFWGKGIATNVWKMLRDFAFESFKIHRMEAGVFSWNPASSKVQEKCGFKLEGRLRKVATRFEKRGDELLYGLLREEWKKIKK